jgi:hypothetical protein
MCGSTNIWTIGVDDERRRIAIRCGTCNYESIVAAEDPPSTAQLPRDIAADTDSGTKRRRSTDRAKPERF